jgi:Na+-driven multidrug efflux pump
MTRGWKVVVAVAAIVVALLLLPFVRDFVDLLGADEDGTDSTVSTLVEWLIAGAIALLLYSAVVAVPGVLARRRRP